MTQTPRVLIHNNDVTAMAERLAEVMPDATIETSDSYEGLDDLLARFKPDKAQPQVFDEAFL